MIFHIVNTMPGSFPWQELNFQFQGLVTTPNLSDGRNMRDQTWIRTQTPLNLQSGSSPAINYMYLVPTIKPLWLSPMITPVDEQVYDLTLHLFQVTMDYSSLYSTFYHFYLTALSHRWCDLAPSWHFQPACLPPQFVESCLQGHLKQSMVGITANLLPCGCTSTFNFIMHTYLLNFNLFHSGYIICQ